jgi:putative transposase
LGAIVGEDCAMARYRRYYHPGGTYFFTVNLADRRSDLLVAEIAKLRHAVRLVRRRFPFAIDAAVVLPDHLHCIWTLPSDDGDYSVRWSRIKAVFSRLIARRETRSTKQQARRERAVWQRRFWEHCIRDERDFANHVAYIHYNPVKHGLVNAPRDWPHSSFHQYVRRGIFPQDWSVPDFVRGWTLG